MSGGTPYLTPAMLQARPSGISWTIVPRLTASTDEQVAQLEQVCWAATSAADTFCRQPLRATVNTESETGPGRSRISVDRHTGIATLITRRWPVRSVAAVQVSPVRAFPPAYSPVPASDVIIRNPVIESAGPAPETGPSGGNAIDIAPGHLDFRHGRGGFRVLASYLSGAGPHASLTEGADAAATQVSVDDVTGWAGTTGYAYDVPGEGVTVTSAAADTPVQLPEAGGTVQAGPGTLTLSGPLASAHDAGTVISAIPPVALRAVALLAAVEALEGINSIAVQSMSGQTAGGTAELAATAEQLLGDFRNWT